MPRSDLQRRLLAYLQTVSVDGVARITQDELAVAMSSHRGSVIRAMRQMQEDGLISEIAPVRATFVTLSGGRVIEQPHR